MRATKASLFAALSLIVVTGAVTTALAKDGSRSDTQLQSTGVDSDARGRASFQLRGTDDGRFTLKLQRLAADSSYDVFVDGVKVGAIQTNSGGNAKQRFRSRPRSSRDLFLGFDPRGVALIVRAEDGSDVLAGNVSVGSSSGHDGSADADEVICCVPDDSGPECEDRTPEECDAAGGTISTATSCLPDPCGGGAPPAGGDVVCCVPDDSGPECEDRTVAECAAEGGVVVEATSCLDNPCAGIPASDPDIRCCLPDDSGTECEDRTPAECIAQGGVDLGPGVCGIDTCGGTTPPGGGNATVIVDCERRSSRSKVSVNGSGLGAGVYTARIVSGANQSTAAPRAAVGDEVEFDFDSNSNDIAAGANAIPAGFLTGTPPEALGQIIDAGGQVVAEASAICRDR